MKNKLGFLGFFGALGLLGAYTGQSGYYGFFGFCAYFYYFTVIPDEMFRENVRRAAAAAFFVLMAVSGIGLGAALVSGCTEWAGAAFALAFAASAGTFSLLMAASELRGAWGARS